MARAFLSGKSALITGGGRGIGKAIAHRFAREGLKVFITGRTEKDLAATCQELKAGGAKAGYAVCDVRREEDVREAVRRATDTFGAVHVLVNNAGTLTLGPAAEASIADHQRQMEVNYFGLVRTTLAVLPGMIKQGFGRIVVVASIGSRRVFPGYGVYDATKFAVAGFTEALRTELAGGPVRVSMVLPGGVDTEMGAPLKKHRLLRRTLVCPDRVAAAVYRLARTGSPEAYVPSALKMLALINAAAPATTDALVRLLFRL